MWKAAADLQTTHDNINVQLLNSDFQFVDVEFEQADLVSHLPNFGFQLVLQHEDSELQLLKLELQRLMTIINQNKDLVFDLIF